MLIGDDIWELMRYGSVRLFFKPKYLSQTLKNLKLRGYKVDSFDCSLWLTKEKMYDDFARVLPLPDWFGHNLDALDDCFTDLDVPKRGGRVIVLKNFEVFAHKMPDIAWNVLDGLERTSRSKLLLGRILMTLLQSNDSRLEIRPIGARPVMLNIHESTAKIKKRLANRNWK